MQTKMVHVHSPIVDKWKMVIPTILFNQMSEIVFETVTIFKSFAAVDFNAF